MFKLNRMLLLGLTVVLVGGVLVTSSSALQCTFKDKPCTALMVADYYYGTPTAPCYPPDAPVVQVTASAQCKGIGPAGPTTFYVCSTFGHPISWSGSGITHTLTPQTTWGDVMETGRCNKIDYEKSAPNEL